VVYKAFGEQSEPKVKATSEATLPEFDVSGNIAFDAATASVQ